MFSTLQSQMRRSATRQLIAAFSLLLLLAAGQAPLRAEPLDYLNIPQVPIDTFNFEGLSLPKNTEDLKKQYPSATSESIGLDEKVGLVCFVVKDLPQADLARFYFFDGSLYQVAITYDPARIERLGGMSAVLRKLVSSFGPSNHAATTRWTWMLNSSLRADFYGTSGGLLVVTKTNLSPVVNKRTRTTELTGATDLGF